MINIKTDEKFFDYKSRKESCLKALDWLKTNKRKCFRNTFGILVEITSAEAINEIELKIKTIENDQQKHLFTNRKLYSQK